METKYNVEIHYYNGYKTFKQLTTMNFIPRENDILRCSNVKQFSTSKSNFIVNKVRIVYTDDFSEISHFIIETHGEY